MAHPNSHAWSVIIIDQHEQTHKFKGAEDDMRWLFDRMRDSAPSYVVYADLRSWYAGDAQPKIVDTIG